jgi:hypothetical protein
VEEKVERAKRRSCDEKNGQRESGREKSLGGSWLFGWLLLRVAFLQEASMLGAKNILNSNSSMKHQKPEESTTLENVDA